MASLNEEEAGIRDKPTWWKNHLAERPPIRKQIEICVHCWQGFIHRTGEPPLPYCVGCGRRSPGLIYNLARKQPHIEV